MPTVYDYDDERDVQDVENDSPDDKTFITDSLFDFLIG